MNRLCKWTLASALVMHSMAAMAAIVIDGGPAFGTPIDVTNTSSGGVLTGGNTRVYNNAAASPVANVYFGLDRTNSGFLGFSGTNDGISGAEVYSWFADTANSIEYRAQTLVPRTTGGGQTVYARLLLVANSGASVVSDATTLGMSGVHSLLHLTGGAFSITREVELSLDGINWGNAQTVYDNIAFKPQGNQFQSSVATGFYWENQQSSGVPEPSSIALIGLALLGLGLASPRTRD